MPFVNDTASSAIREASFVIKVASLYIILNGMDFIEVITAMNDN
jgi:hypothetical protein